MQYFKSKDFYLASTLIYEGYEIEDFEKDDGKTIFFFADTPALRETVQQYFHDEIYVTPFRYQTAIKQAKAIIYAREQ